MPVLVTGATGFLGQHLVRALLGRGDSVIALGRDRQRLEALAEIGATAVRFDLATGDPSDIALPVFDAVVHCAALSSPWGRWSEFHAANVTGTETALQIARAAGARRFVHISSPTVGFALRDQEGLSETTPLPKPINAYAGTKAEAERRVLAADGLDVISLRPRGIYGAGDTALLPRLVRAARSGPLPLLRGGVACIDLTHVNDVVSAILAALEAGPSAMGSVVNISGGEPLPVREIVERAAGCAGIEVRWKPMPLRPVLALARGAELACGLLPGLPEPRVTRYGLGLFAYRQSLDLSRARGVLDWRPSIRFAEGLDLTFAQEQT